MAVYLVILVFRKVTGYFFAAAFRGSSEQVSKILDYGISLIAIFQHFPEKGNSTSIFDVMRDLSLKSNTPFGMVFFVTYLYWIVHVLDCSHRSLVRSGI